jgi:hypothetical protein
MCAHDCVPCWLHPSKRTSRPLSVERTLPRLVMSPSGVALAAEALLSALPRARCAGERNPSMVPLSTIRERLLKGQLSIKSKITQP